MKIIAASKTDKRDIVTILCKSFTKDPHIKYIVGDEIGYKKRYKRLMCYAFEQARANGYIEMTDDKQSVSIWRKYNSKKMTFSLLIESVLFFYYFGISGMKRITEMEKNVQSNYPKDTSFLYLWFIGTLPKSQGLGYGRALLNPIVQKCKVENTEIYLETSTAENVAYYKRKGFEVYNKMNFGSSGEVNLFLLRYANKNISQRRFHNEVKSIT